MTTTTTDLDTLSVNTIRGLAPPEYRDQVLPREVTARVAFEQASTLGWDRYVGGGGAVIGMHTFGASAPLKQLLTKFGFTPEQVAQVARERVTAARDGRA